jgi:tryptophan synthase alpha chain
MKSLEVNLRELRRSGRKALITYFVAGATKDWVRYVEAAVVGGADVVEIGIPFSDPMMDGAVIQEASLRALHARTTLDSILADLAGGDVDVPLIAMTYYNIFLHYGLERAAAGMREYGISGAIIPDLPLEEANDWRQACYNNDIATVLLVAPSSPPLRSALIARASEGFVYAQARMSVTGASDERGDGARVVETVREATDRPAYIGIGVTTAEQAREAATKADGVIVGSALVQLMLDGAGPREVEEKVAEFRRSLDLRL